MPNWEIRTTGKHEIALLAMCTCCLGGIMADEEIPDNWIIRLRCLTVRRRQCWWYHGAGQQYRWGAWSAGIQSPRLHFVQVFRLPCWLDCESPSLKGNE